MTDPVLDATLTVDAGADLVTVIERFAVGPQAEGPGPDSQAPPRPGAGRAVSADLAAAVERASAQLEDWSRQDGFVAAMVLRSREHDALSVYSQWRAPSGGAPSGVPERWSAAEVLAGPGPGARLLDARTFTVEFTAGEPSPSVLSVGSTPLAHFGVFTMAADQQDALLDLARDDAPGSLGTPGIVTVNFHRSVDGTEVINLGAWTTLDAFEQLLDQPGFADGEVYWQGVADFEPDFFDVVEVRAHR